MNTVLSLGGSLLYEKNRFNTTFVKKIGVLLAKQKKLAVVVGGGVRARKAANAVRARGKTEFFADEAAIKATRWNARAIAKAIGSRAVFARAFEDAVRAIASSKIPVMGGVLPGLTTDAVAVLLAERLSARRVINASDVDGVYSIDPKKSLRAKKFPRLTHKQLVALAVEQDSREAGANFIFDLVACKLAARSSIRLEFVNGRNLEELGHALKGVKHSGTIVE